MKKEKQEEKTFKNSMFIIMQNYEVLKAYTLGAPDRGFPKINNFKEVLQDGSSIRIVRRDQPCVKYLAHMILIKPDADDPYEGSRGWSPRGHKAAGVIGLRMDHMDCAISGQSSTDMTHSEWITFCRSYGIFDDALGQLCLTEEQRAAAEWSNRPGEYFSRNIWFRGHWEWLRFQELNPTIPVVTHSLAEILAATQQSSQ